MFRKKDKDSAVGEQGRGILNDDYKERGSGTFSGGKGTWAGPSGTLGGQKWARTY